jgi:CDP-diglyceride synthetase
MYESYCFGIFSYLLLLFIFREWEKRENAKDDEAKVIPAAFCYLVIIVGISSRFVSFSHTYMGWHGVEWNGMIMSDTLTFDLGEKKVEIPISDQCQYQSVSVTYAIVF